jgi:hypothetical protein
MVDETCPYFHTATRERDLCQVKEDRWGGREVPQLNILECNSCNYLTCETYQGQQRVFEKARGGLNKASSQEVTH